MYLALYRKWRPATFDDIYGQPHITETLKREVMSNKLSHAYIFTGSRGTGKTSCARVLAKAANCPHAVNGNPCNECEICRGIDNGTLTDVVEMDAASNNGVDEMRELRDKINFLPSIAKYRVYIIDEVHMLSTSAFNAFLKMLEEPPEHVIFILATTDIHKVLPTILSRCQRFDFRRISSADIKARLQYVAQNENITLTDRAAGLIANISDGGMRDALSILDRCAVISDKIDSEEVQKAAGVASSDNLFKMSSYAASGDFKSALLLVSELYAGYCDVYLLGTSLLDHFRNLMVTKSVNDCSDLIICSREDLERYKQRAAEFSMSKILECIEILSSFNSTVKTASNKRILLESALIKMCGVKDSLPSPQVKPAAETPAPVKTEEPKKEEPGPVSAEKPEEDEKEEKSEAPAETDNREIKVPPVETADYPEGPFSLWPEIKERLKSYDMALFAVLSETSAIYKNGKIVILTTNASLKEYIVSNNYASSLKNAIIDVTGKEMKAAISVTNAEIPKKEPEKEDETSPLGALISKINEFNG